MEFGMNRTRIEPNRLEPNRGITVMCVFGDVVIFMIVFQQLFELRLRVHGVHPLGCPWALRGLCALSAELPACIIDILIWAFFHQNMLRNKMPCCTNLGQIVLSHAN